MLPSDETGGPPSDRPSAGGHGEPDTNEGNSRGEDVNPEEGIDREAGAPQNLGLLFIAAAVALALLLALVGLIAFASFASTTRQSEPSAGRGAARDEAHGAPLGAGERPAVAHVVHSGPAGERRGLFPREEHPDVALRRELGAQA